MTASGRSLWTWILTICSSPGDQHGVADRLEVRLDRGDVERRGRGAARTQVDRLVAVGGLVGGPVAACGVPVRRGRARGAAAPPARPPRPRAPARAPPRARPGTGGTGPGRRSRRRGPRAGSAGATGSWRRRARRRPPSRRARPRGRCRARRSTTAAAAASRMTVRIVPSTGFGDGLVGLLRRRCRARGRGPGR